MKQTQAVQSDLFVAIRDSQISRRLECTSDVKMREYLDDFPVSMNQVVPGDRDGIVANLLRHFIGSADGLKFMHELDVMGVLQFLDAPGSGRIGSVLFGIKTASYPSSQPVLRL